MTALAWIEAAAVLPDDDTWRYVDAMPITAERVTHWMHMPPAPGAAS